MSIVSFDPPLNGIVTIHGQNYQTMPKSGQEINWYPSREGDEYVYYIDESENEDYAFHIPSQTWVMPYWSQDESQLQSYLEHYFDLIPFHGNEPPILYTLKQLEPRSSDYVFQILETVTSDVAILLGKEQVGYYYLKVRNPQPYRFGLISSGYGYEWFMPVLNTNLKIAMTNVYGDACLLDGDELVLRSFHDFMDYWERDKERLSLIPWTEVFEIFTTEEEYESSLL